MEKPIQVPDAQIVFLDTCVILDYLENRREEVHDIVAVLLLLHENGQVILATSAFNVAELIDKEFEIHFIGELLQERLSYDEIAGQRGNRTLFREVSQRKRASIEKRLDKFLFDNGIMIMPLEFESEIRGSEYSDLYSLVYEHQLRSQDAVIVATALQNSVTYLLSNDSDLVSKLNENGLIDAYSLRDERQRQAFKGSVLNTKVEVLT